MQNDTVGVRNDEKIWRIKSLATSLQAHQVFCVIVRSWDTEEYEADRLHARITSRAGEQLKKVSQTRG